MNPSLRVFETSCRTGEGIEAWCDWLRARSAAAG
jgi:Ni2+-binding GTPase involved in maturation of urease and hydrogenase